MKRQESTTKIGIVIQYVNHPFLENLFWGLPPYTRQIGLPSSRVNYTVLRSPHIDKKSREQFEMKMKREFWITETHELRKKFFRLKRQRIFGAQYEIVFSCKTRSDKGKLQRLL
uniref:Ribosomal protein S10 n=1 Tax=Utricularia gibba TaxID=13748 RepID=R4QY95_UTRGI|nr:ribosomal protein S10 [Utricularia gibba]